MEVETIKHASSPNHGNTLPIRVSRVYQADLALFLQSVNQREVQLFIKEACGTHYSRLYVFLKILDKTGEFTWVHEVFSNFSTDWDGRKRSMKLAIHDMVEVESNLQKNGFKVRNGDGLDCNEWHPCEVHQTTHYCLHL